MITLVGNLYHEGPSTTAKSLLYIKNTVADLPEHSGLNLLQIYLDDNLRYDKSGTPDPSIPMLSGVNPEKYIVESPPVWNNNIQLISANDLAPYIVQNVGARPWESNAIDDRIISQWQNHTGSIIDWETEVGGFPDLPSTNRGASWDTDGDGMPNSWEQSKGLNPNQKDHDGFDLDNNNHDCKMIIKR